MEVFYIQCRFFVRICYSLKENKLGKMEKSESVFTLTPMTQKLRLQPGEVREDEITM